MTKQELRQSYLRKRAQLEKKVWQEHTVQIIDQALSFIESGSFQHVNVFLPLLSKKEVNTWPLMSHILEKGLKASVPGVLDHQKMEALEVKKGCIFELGAYQIPEPKKKDPLDPKDIDLIFVPLLVADQKGQRIGYGKGYYDRFIKELKPDSMKVGLSLFSPLEEALPREPWDQRLNALIHPLGLYIY